MCSVIIGLHANPHAPLFFAANRDEWRARPTAPYGLLEPGIRGGKDLKAGGTWFARRDDGAMAFLTNIRPGSPGDPKKKTRGTIVLDLLKADDMRAHAASIDASLYNPFNVVFGRGDEWFHLRGEGDGGVQRISSGVHVLGNLSLNHPEDPKTAYVRAHLADAATLSVDALRVRLEEALESDALTIDAGPYGTRWSMMWVKQRLFIAENSALAGPLLEQH